MKQAKKEKELSILGTELSSVSIKNERLFIKCILPEDDSALPIVIVEISNSDIQNHPQLKSVVKNIVELRNLLFEAAQHKGLSIQDETIIVDLPGKNIRETNMVKLRTKISFTQRLESSTKTEETRSEQSNSEKLKPVSANILAQPLLILAIVAAVVCCFLGFFIYLERIQNNQFKSTLLETEVKLKEQKNHFEVLIEKEKSQKNEAKARLMKMNNEAEIEHKKYFEVKLQEQKNHFEVLIEKEKSQKNEAKARLMKMNNEAEIRHKKYLHFQNEFQTFVYNIYTAKDGSFCGKSLSEYTVNKARQLQITFRKLF